jgi:hypothetical protein
MPVLYDAFMLRRRRLRIRTPRRGRRIRVGRLGDVASYGPTRAATLLVGLKKGQAPQNRRGACARLPGQLTTSRVDKLFLAERRKQVGAANVGATRQDARGWYQGAPEKSAAYEVIFIPNDVEPDWRAFTRNMKKLAEKMAKNLCQDEVILVTDNAGKKATYAASCPRRTSC